jgi:hypothetical protein
MKKPVFIVEIPNDADPRGLSIDHPDQGRQAFSSRVLVNGVEISGSVFSFRVVHRKGIERLILEVKDFEVYAGDDILKEELVA